MSGYNAVCIMNDKSTQRLIRLALYVPFLLGLSWSLCLKYRGIFIDEHALDPHQFSTHPYSISRQDLEDKSSFNQSLCQRLQYPWEDFNPSPSCISITNFVLIKILPFHSTPVTIPVEAIVLVIPSPSSFHTDHDSYQELYFTNLLNQLIVRLQNSPWLAKTILIVIPKNYNSNVEKTLDSFLQAYLGGDDEINKFQLPPSFNMFIIRQLLVVDLYHHQQQQQKDHDLTSSSSSYIEILSQGPRGLLPNLDLVFVTIQTLGRYLPNQYKMVVHPWDITWWERFLSRQVQALNLGSAWYLWSTGLVNMGAFVTTMIRGPYGPHSTALERGIDSITIRLKLPPISNNKLSSTKEGSIIKIQTRHDHGSIITHSQIFQSVEHLVRALSNLHERLHHSVNLYLLQSPVTFVSIGEYIFPCILILFPFVIRAISLLFIEIDSFQPNFVGLSILTITVHSFFVYFLARYMNPTFLGMIYVNLLFTWYRFVKPRFLTKTTKDLRQSLLFMAYVFVLYSHAPLVLIHVSLAYFSAIYWVILWGLYGRGKESSSIEFVGGIVNIFLVIVSWPPVLIVPYMFQEFTDYVCLVYIPLHLFLTLLVVL